MTVGWSRSESRAMRSRARCPPRPIPRVPTPVFHGLGVPGRWPALHGGFQGALFVAVPRCGVDQGDRRASCR
jgi:hypothetical protein